MVATTRSPARAKRSAVKSPKPLEQPVMKTFAIRGASLRRSVKMTILTD
jgi:hypothetical protein